MGWIPFACIVVAYSVRIYKKTWWIENDLKSYNNKNDDDDDEKEEKTERKWKEKNLWSSDILSNEWEKYAKNEARMCLFPEAE